MQQVFHVSLGACDRRFDHLSGRAAQICDARAYTVDGQLTSCLVAHNTAFADVLAAGLDLVWRWSEKFPRSRPVSAFKRYIALVQFDTDYYYTAYPRATTNDVKAAHRVCAALEDLGKSSGDMSPADFNRAYLQFLIRVQKDLGATGVGPIGT